MNSILFLLYDVSVYFTLISKYEPFVVMFLGFLLVIFGLQLRLEYCAIVGAVFFASLLHQSSSSSSKMSFNKELYKIIWLCVPLYVSLVYNLYLGVFIQLLLDYYVFSRDIYQAKTYNRLAILLCLTVWNGRLVDSIAIILGISVGHGVYLHYK